MLAHDRSATLWDAARLLSVGEEGYSYRNRVGARIRGLPAYREISAFFTDELSAQLADSRSLEWREWETAEKQKRQAVSIVADTVQFLERAGERGGGEAGEDSSDSRELIGVGAEQDDLAF